MRVITAGRAGRTEKVLAETLSATAIPGILLVQAQIVAGRRVREVDAILFHPCGIFTIEGKYTSAHGVVVPYAGGWSVGGVLDERLGDPEAQASQQAKMLASLLFGIGRKRGRIRSIISIAGENCRLEARSLNTDVYTTHLTGLSDLIAELVTGRPIYDLEDVLAIRDALHLNPVLLDEEMIQAEWEKAGAPISLAHTERDLGPVVKKVAERIPTPRILGYLSTLLLAMYVLPDTTQLGAGIGVGVLAVIQYFRMRGRRR